MFLAAGRRESRARRKVEMDRIESGRGVIRSFQRLRGKTTALVRRARGPANGEVSLGGLEERNGSGGTSRTVSGLLTPEYCDADETDEHGLLAYDLCDRRVAYSHAQRSVG